MGNALSLAVFAFAKEDRTVLLLVTRAARASVFLWSRYSSPRATRACSYSRMAASDVMDGVLEMMSVYISSALRGSDLASFCASSTLSESTCDIVGV